MVTYRGFLADGKVFDSNQGKDPISFKLGAGKVIKGWERGLAKTCPGEQVVMIIPPELGYGEKGAGGGVIPGGATLYFITTLDGLVRLKEVLFLLEIEKQILPNYHRDVLFAFH